MDVPLRDIRMRILRALEQEWYRANQAGHSTGDYSRRNLIKALDERVRKWEPAAPTGGPAHGGKAGKGSPGRPPAVERADRLMQMLAEIPELDNILSSTELVQQVLQEARREHERMNESRSSSRSRNPFSAIARMRSTRAEIFPRSRTSASPDGSGPQAPRKIAKRR
ncbi:hypothetical protein [Micromonospora sp. C95]|uniref:hypothetical protein n=1 Tax=Micromonospora sp. C95 TaxID=2824882 RepID=UPI001B36480F|nr:hypothetical protein [Micromonospora sp. C95]MBQ1028362.1 hypothetical protein [Micromonospora sp. C95]